MKWICNACQTKARGDVCQSCGTPLPDPATTPATEKMHRALRSTPFVIAVICFTLAILFSVTVGLIQPTVVSTADVHDALAVLKQEIGLTVPDNVVAALDEAVATTRTDVSDVVSANLLPALACVGLWLLVATGFRSGRVGRAGAVILKVITVFELVCVCLGMAAVMAIAVFLQFGKDFLLKLVADLGAWDGLMQSLRTLMNEPIYTAAVWVTAGSLLAAMLVALFFLLGAIKTENEVIRVSKFGQSRKVSVFLCILLIIGAVPCLIAGLVDAFSLDLSSVGALLSGLYMLLFAITILRYRRWSREVLWSDVHPEAVDKAFAAIPTDLATDDLLNTAEYGAPDAAATAETAEPEVPAEPDLPEVSEEPDLPEVPDEPEAPKTSETAVEQFMASIRPAADAKPAASATTVCPHCGAVMKGKAFFCEECGQVL